MQLFTRPVTLFSMLKICHLAACRLFFTCLIHGKCMVTWLGLMSLGLFSQWSVAEKRVDLYSVSQLVIDQSVGLRQQATAKGLATVLVRVSGRKDTLSHPLVREAVTQATSYLNQYSYSSTDETITIAGSSRPASQLLLQYSSTSIQRLLQQAQIVTWPENRPEVLLWVASNPQQQKRLLDKQAQETLAIKAAGELRGLPIVMPLLDLLDRQTLSASRLWAMDEIAIRDASNRYGADGVLAGRFTQTSATVWQGSFLLLHKGERYYFNGRGATPQSVAESIIDQTATYFSNRDAVIVNDEQSAQSMMIAVENIVSFERYAGLVNYLNDLPLVAGTTVTRVDGSQVILQLRFNGSEEKLLATLEESPIFIQRPVEFKPFNGSTALAIFSWRASDQPRDFFNENNASVDGSQPVKAGASSTTNQ